MFYNADMQIIKKSESESVDGAFSWKELKVSAIAPEGTTDVMVGCFSENNQGGAVLFDDMSLIRTS
jgi:hypothetical protein